MTKTGQCKNCKSPQNWAKPTTYLILRVVFIPNIHFGQSFPKTNSQSPRDKSHHSLSTPGEPNQSDCNSNSFCFVGQIAFTSFRPLRDSGVEGNDMDPARSWFRTLSVDVHYSFSLSMLSSKSGNSEGAIVMVKSKRRR